MKIECSRQLCAGWMDGQSHSLSSCLSQKTSQNNQLIFCCQPLPFQFGIKGFGLGTWDSDLSINHLLVVRGLETDVQKDTVSL